MTPTGGATRRSAELAIVDELRLWGGERLLFLECGDGWVAEEAWRRMVKGYVCGLDTSPRGVALATELRAVPGKLEFKTWDGRCVPYPDESFDSVVSQCDVRRWLEPVSVLREIRRVVRSGGEVYLVEMQPGAGSGPLSAGADWPWLVEQAGLLLHEASSSPVGADVVVGDDRRPARMRCARPVSSGAGSVSRSDEPGGVAGSRHRRSRAVWARAVAPRLHEQHDEALRVFQPEDHLRETR